MKKPSIKRTPVTNICIADAIGYAYGELSSLRDEIDEVVQNMSDSPGLAATSRFVTLEETLFCLEECCDEPEIPDGLEEVRCSYTENRERKLTRAGRRDNATGAMSAVCEALREWADEQETNVGEKKADGDSEEDTHEELEGRISEARELADTLEECYDRADEAEFPGMMG